MQHVKQSQWIQHKKTDNRWHESGQNTSHMSLKFYIAT